MSVSWAICVLADLNAALDLEISVNLLINFTIQGSYISIVCKVMK